MSATRKFTVIAVSTARGIDKTNDFLGGEFKSHTAVGAVKKAATRICAACKLRPQCALIIRIKEITSKSKGKEYVYKVKRFKNDTTVSKDGKEILFKYTIKATSLNQFHDIPAVQSVLSPSKKTPTATPTPKKKTPSPKKK